MKNKLQKIDLFRNIDEKILLQICSMTTSVRFEQNSIIFYEGDSSRYLHCLVLGVIKLYKISSSNKEIVLKYFHTNELIAEVANFEAIAYPATAVAYTEVEILKIDFEKFKKSMYDTPEIAFKMQISLIKKIKNLEQVISTHLVLDAKGRVAKFIYDNPQTFFSIKNKEIATILNISPETLSRILRVFKDEQSINMELKTINSKKLKESI